MTDNPKYVCGECATPTSQWAGRCARCGTWNSLVPQGTTPAADSRAQPIAEVDPGVVGSTGTGIEELDRVLGGGLVPGSVTLLGGEPGIGKSTLALQLAASWAAGGGRVIYASAEESAAQVRARGDRLAALDPQLWLMATDDLGGLLGEVSRLTPQLVVVDSVQTMRVEGATSGPLAQLREVTRQLVERAKASGLTVVLIGQVTKDGELAGPKSLEHLVDTVLSFEGDRHQSLRFLRAIKHRFGATGDVGLFEMGPSGLGAVADPSAIFLRDRVTGVPGSTVVPILEGDRPVLVEAQALVSPRVLPHPRRTAQGLDSGRVGLLAAVLEQRGQLPLHECDVHTSIVGGIRVVEPAADLGVLLAMASAHLDRAIGADTVACGEVGLVGEVRVVNDIERRLHEAERLGFRRALVPSSYQPASTTLELIGVTHVVEALGFLRRERRLNSTAA